MHRTARAFADELKREVGGELDRLASQVCNVCEIEHPAWAKTELCGKPCLHLTLGHAAPDIVSNMRTPIAGWCFTTAVQVSRLLREQVCDKDV